ncbi:right-handed parallel beta-helix repeat-containing protein [Sphingomonas sp. LY54]|uniref:right-handed parallel beta-helix repeat-containing protein n=1 Tax=Sphingomonas sp. LY54 TaxID=3095343 RepID=UPI002D7833DD|nr:right-handed parallel beta-helix repeat-containing protein [Sphingomonas sp. LY54]WRP27572.1 right-handed parallel beta-helix repeat-containing protein [Sphingomonas sp. LY54]
MPDAAQPGQIVDLEAGRRSGRFVWNAGNMAAEIAGDPSGGVYVPSSADPSGRTGAWVRQVEGGLQPEWFGALGDGVTNDTAALAALAAFVTRKGGGEISLRRTTYLVGGQRRSATGPFAFAPDPILDFKRCTRPLIIRGNGARLKCVKGLRYGTFEARSDRPAHHKAPYYGDGRATPYWAMIRIDDCTGLIEVSDLELDGSLDGHRLGGMWGDLDGGRQIGAFGLALYNNRGREMVRNVYAHHHALDGILIDGPDVERAEECVFEQVRCEYNGRQGVSVVGGRGYAFIDSQFNHTGKAAIVSAPGAGVDIEAEGGKTVRKLRFENCEFSNNAGCGLVAESGPAEDIAFRNCVFIGTTNWAAWPRKPGMAFDRCTFVGPVTNCYGDARNPAAATRFTNCFFRDDPKLSPSGLVYQPGPIVALSQAPNVSFRRCDFRLTHGHVLPWTHSEVIFADCTMSQRKKDVAYPRGTFLGRNTIVGNVDLTGAKIVGEVIVNGVRRS